MQIPRVSSINNVLYIASNPKKENNAPETQSGSSLPTPSSELLQAYNINFGYHHPLKTLFLKGKLPFVKVGFYGDVLTPKNVTLEHIEPVFNFKQRIKNPNKAKELATVWENLALASKDANNTRGCDLLIMHLNREAIEKYLAQFEGEYIPGYGPGEKYIEAIRETVNRIIEQEREQLKVLINKEV